jgi:hypothetical protein
LHAEGVVLLLGSAADDVVAQQDTHNCGVLSYRWIEQRVCNSVINYTTLDVAYLRRLLQVELVHGRPMRLIQDAEYVFDQSYATVQLRYAGRNMPRY